MDRRGGAGPSLARVESDHDRDVQPRGELAGPRAGHRLPSLEQGPHGDEHDQVHVLCPAVVELEHGVARDQHRIDDPR